MATRLPVWVWVGAAALSCVAGIVNVVGYLGFEHQAITHLTGTTTLLGSAVAAGDPRATTRLAGVVLAFVAGAALSAIIVQDSTLRLGRRYGVALALESAMLFAAVPLFEHGHFAAPLLAAMACGLQNAMATTYSGALVRATHVSGMFTDLGIGLGHALRGMPLPPRRLPLSGLVIASFFVGAIAGAATYRAAGYRTLLVPAALTGLVGIGYAAYRQFAVASSLPRTRP